MYIQPARLWADMNMDEPSDEKQHVRGSRCCSAASARVRSAIRTVGDPNDIREGSEHWEAIEHCTSLFARGEWFLSMGQPEAAQTHFREAASALNILVKTITANLGERVEPVVVTGNWDAINILTPSQYKRGGAYVGALGGRGRRVGNVY